MHLDARKIIQLNTNKFRYRKVLLVSPPYPGSMGRRSLHSGLGYLAEALRQGGIEYDVLDMDLGYSNRHLRRKIDTFLPDLVGVSMITFNYKNSYALLRFIKKISSVPIIVGGPHMCAFEKTVFSQCNAVDYGLLGEGEEGLVDLCQGRDVTQINGLLYKSNGNILENERMNIISNLDKLAFPRYHKFEMQKYASRVISIVSSRGCPYGCTFCTVSSSMGKKVRTRSPFKVVDEIEYWYKRGQRRFGVSDDNFTFFPDRVHEICDEIERRQLKNLKLQCDNGIRADKVSKDLLIRMKEVGVYTLGIGVEGGNDKILKLLKKGETISQIEKAIKIACELGFEVSLHFVIGTPGETWKDIEDSFALARKYPVRGANFNNLIPYPGTKSYRWVADNKYFFNNSLDVFSSISPSSRIPVFETSELSREERITAFKHAEFVTKEIRKNFYNKKLEPYFSWLGWFLSLTDDIKKLMRGHKWGIAIFSVKVKEPLKS